jgi:UDPglucose 6-dehydrogenase
MTDKETSRRVAVIGSGYVGTVVAACLARLGHQVIGVESDPSRLAALQDGRAPFTEAGLDDLLVAGRAAGRLRFTAELAQAMTGSDVVFLCVGTPPGEGGTPDMSAVRDVARAIAPHLGRRHILVNKSTVPVGSGRWLASMLGQAAGDLAGPRPTVVSNPEFLREGQAIEDFLHPDRVVLGSDDPRALDELAALYRPILEQRFAGCPPGRPPVPLVRTDVVTAELSKYASNAFLATKVSFANEMARVCDVVGADVTAVTAVMGLDHRIGGQFLAAGIGWGGSCLGKDVAALIATTAEHGWTPRILRAAAEVNDDQRQLVVLQLQRALTSLRDVRVALLGLSFKPHTDDLRDSPAVDIGRRLVDRGAVVTAFDPAVRAVPGFEELRLRSDVYSAAGGADAVVLATDWPEFACLDLGRLRRAMRGDVFVDGRNLSDPEAVTRAGLSYYGIGRALHTTAVVRPDLAPLGRA